ncbi:MAG: sulfotransferase family 2 domain-containing protein [Cocleimonas sp.]|nr:sulfotransferase family 2 domain-containing protein [Sulfurovaceae bacterium]MCK5917013.1 sulfotransferase family 2 domain-containing protein [Cocleimonas sp.]
MSDANNNRLFNFCDNNSNLHHNPQFQFAQKHTLCLYQKNAIYSFIPKNGCTTLRATLAVGNGLVSPDTLSNSNINWIHNNTYAFSANLKDLIRTEYRFTVLRNPYSRAVSLFLDKFVDKTPVAWNFYRQTSNAYDLNTLTFSDFINHLYKHPHIINGDIHWRKQADFLIYQDYDDYFNFDNFALIEKTLENKLSLKTIDTRKITKHGKDQHEFISEKNYATTSANELLNIKLKGKLPNDQSMLNDELKTKIRKIYQADFTLCENKLKLNTF